MFALGSMCFSEMVLARVPAPIESLVRQEGSWVVENSAIKLYELPSTGEIVIPGFLGAAMCLVAFEHYYGNARKIALCEEVAGHIANGKKEIFTYFDTYLEKEMSHLPPEVAQKMKAAIAPTLEQLKSVVNSKEVNDGIDKVTNYLHVGPNELQAARGNISYNIALGALGLTACCFSLYKCIQAKTHIGLDPIIAITPASFVYDGKTVLWNDISSVIPSEDAKSLRISCKNSADVITINKFDSAYSLAELEILLKACLKTWCA